MKLHEYCFILAVLLLILSFLYYSLSTTFYSSPDQSAVSNILGQDTEADSLVAAEDIISDVRTEQRQSRSMVLWIGVTSGALLFIAGLFIKRKIDGPDRFIDDASGDEDDDFFFTAR
ncbi:MAG: hypothetical protein ACOY90_21550 [Candidatus Zhuqueibacterota bacterium]